jgi:hypothetical protein
MQINRALISSKKTEETTETFSGVLAWRSTGMQLRCAHTRIRNVEAKGTGENSDTKSHADSTLLVSWVLSLNRNDSEVPPQSIWCTAIPSKEIFLHVLGQLDAW